MPRALLAVPLALLASCTCGSYLCQATGGQFELWKKARPIEVVRADPAVPDRVRALLAKVPEIKAFGEAHGLTATSNYETYADLQRPAAVWVVSASEPLRFESRTWWFPIVGTFPYLGWFNEDAAAAFAKDLRAEPEGWDVDVRPASAYSTLGWFRDAVLSTMIPAGAEAGGSLANTVLHESVHATLHVPGQAWFNESLASWVADRLTLEWLATADAPDRDAWVDAEARGQQRLERYQAAWRELDALYRSARSDTEKRADKAKILAALEAAMQARRPINNATLVQFRTYATGAAEFEALFAACREWPRFWNALAGLEAAAEGRSLEGELGAVLRGLGERCR